MVKKLRELTVEGLCDTCPLIGLSPRDQEVTAKHIAYFHYLFNDFYEEFYPALEDIEKAFLIRETPTELVALARICITAQLPDDCFERYGYDEEGELPEPDPTLF